MVSFSSAAFLSKGDAEHALADAEACVSLKPDWSKGFGRKGAALYALKQFDDAISAYEKGLEVEPSSEALKSALDEVRTAKAEAAAPKRGMPGTRRAHSPNLNA